MYIESEYDFESVKSVVRACLQMNRILSECGSPHVSIQTRVNPETTEEPAQVDAGIQVDEQELLNNLKDGESPPPSPR